MSSVRFIADGMLGSLARKLRMFGFDTLYYNDIEDEKLLAIGRQEDRTLLTRDKSLFQRAVKAGISSMLLEGIDDVDYMVHVMKNSGIRSVEFVPAKSRCPLCNGEIDMRDIGSLDKSIPKKVVDTHTRFYVCKKCGKVYWEGSHFTKLQQFGLDVMRRLNNAS
ncbi:MAG: Mut7-C RNAse domain-containing protein [Nitrososphaerales archaeon]